MNTISSIYENIKQISKSQNNLLVVFGCMVGLVFLAVASVFFLINKLNIIGAAISVPILIVVQVLVIAIPVLFFYICFTFLSNRSKIARYKKELESAILTTTGNEEASIRDMAIKKAKFLLDFNIRSIFIVIIFTLICIIVSTNLLNK